MNFIFNAKDIDLNIGAYGYTALAFAKINKSRKIQSILTDASEKDISTNLKPKIIKTNQGSASQNQNEIIIGSASDEAEQHLQVEDENSSEADADKQCPEVDSASGGFDQETTEDYSSNESTLSPVDVDKDKNDEVLPIARENSSESKKATECKVKSGSQRLRSACCCCRRDFGYYGTNNC